MKLFLTILLLTSSVKAKELSHRDIYNAVNNYHPKLLENLLKVEEYKGRIQESKGEFDTKFQANYFDRTSGYYTGTNLSATLSKPIGALNSKIYGGYKKGTNTQPIYDGQYLTGNDGRYVIGGEINIFRNSEIYQNSINVLKSKMDMKKIKILYDLTRIDVLKKALFSYWDWVAKGMKLQAYENLLQLAEARQVTMNTQVKHGDIAQYYAIENTQYIMQRRNQLQDAQNQFNIASYNLSIYLRNSNGEMVSVDKSNIPKKISSVYFPVNAKNDIQAAKQVNPSLKMLSIEIAKEENNIKIAKAKTLPKASLQGEYYQDMGTRPTSKQNARARIGIMFEMPLERRSGSGKIVQIQNKVRQIKQQAILIENTIFSNIQGGASTVQAFTTMWHNAEKEYKIASQLVSLERQSVDEGNSDFFTLNLREKSQFQAKVKAIEFHTNLNKAYIDYSALLMKIDTLF